jgi:hypothetical protein
VRGKKNMWINFPVDPEDDHAIRKPRNLRGCLGTFLAIVGIVICFTIIMLALVYADASCLPTGSC